MKRKAKKTTFVPRLFVTGLAGAVPTYLAVTSSSCSSNSGTGPVALAIASFDADYDVRDGRAHADGNHGDAGNAEAAMMVISLAIASFDAAADVVDATAPSDADKPEHGG
jgi:hypothetical protein